MISTKKKTSLIISILAAILLLIVVIRKIYIYINIDNYKNIFLVKTQEPEKINVIYSLAGSIPHIREKKAFELFQTYRSSLWVLSSPFEIKHFEEIFKDTIDRSRVLRIPDNTNTFEEIFRFKLLIEDRIENALLPKKKGEISIAIVSTWWHLKRVKMLCDYLLKTNNTFFIYPDNKDIMKKYTKGTLRNEFRDIHIDWFRLLLYKISFNKINFINKSTIDETKY